MQVTVRAARAQKNENRQKIKREYRDGINSKDTRLGWEAHNVCKVYPYDFFFTLLQCKVKQLSSPQNAQG